MGFQLKEPKEKFVVHKATDNKYHVCKIVETFDSEQKALEGLMKIMNKKK